MKHFVKIILIGLLLSNCFPAIAQETTVPKKAEPFALDTLVVANRLTDEILQEAKKIIADTNSYLALYDAYQILLSTNEYLVGEDSIYADYTQLQLSRFEETSRFWVDYNAELASLKSQTSTYITEISRLVPELTQLRQRWLATRLPSDDSIVISEAILENVDAYAKSIEKTVKRLGAYLDAFVRFDAHIAKQIKQADVATAAFNELVLSRAKSVFSIDSEPLFSAVAKDTTGLMQALHIGWTVEKEEFINFWDEKKGRVFGHLFYTLVVMVLVFLLFRKSKKKQEYAEGVLSVDASILRFPLLSGLIIGMFSTRMFYSGLPVLYVNLLIAISLIPASVLLPKILKRKLPRLPYILVVIVFLSLLIGFFRNDVVYERVALLLAAIIAMVGLSLIIFNIKNKKAVLAGGGRLVLGVLYLFELLIIISIIANIIGMSQLGLLFSVGVVFSFTTGIIAFVAVKMTQSVLRLLGHSQIAQSLKLVSANLPAIEKWIVILTNLIGIIFWLTNVLISFKVYSTIQDMYSEFVLRSWSFGEVSLSLQNILDFVFIVFIFYVIANFIHLLIQDEILPRYNLRSGLPLGLAVLSRYIILLFGFVLAMSAAGISLSKLNLLLGALGVGIGFGLQNIVSNFVSGFVIIFEQPIHIGDIVTTGTTEGEVTAIGLRSSRIRTYDGAEVVVPNNNFTASELSNWTYSDLIRREVRFILVEGENNPRLVKQIIDNIMQAHPEVERKKDSVALFMGYENRALKFRLLIWSGRDYVRITSEVLLNLHDALLANGFKPYMPTQKVIVESQTDSYTGKIIGNPPENKPDAPIS